jgi:uncharacterized protein (DUF849 family)
VPTSSAGATVLHLHVRELDGKGSKRLAKFNELIAGVRAEVPDLIIQMGGGRAARGAAGFRIAAAGRLSDYGCATSTWLAAHATKPATVRLILIGSLLNVPGFHVPPS